MKNLLFCVSVLCILFVLFGCTSNTESNLKEEALTAEWTTNGKQVNDLPYYTLFVEIRNTTNIPQSYAPQLVSQSENFDTGCAINAEKDLNNIQPGSMRGFDCQARWNNENTLPSGTYNFFLKIDQGNTIKKELIIK